MNPFEAAFTTRPENTAAVREWHFKSGIKIAILIDCVAAPTGEETAHASL
jgi:hypothetical protein